jgi:peptidoglycan/LPS O-acetylase OafA/YrhL
MMARQYGALRGLAIVLVVLNHSIVIGGEWVQRLGYPDAVGWEQLLLNILHRLGFFAVPTFFFVSGAYLTYMARGNPPTVTWASVKAVVKRILIPYLFWSFVFYGLVFARYAEQYTLFGYFKKLLFGYPFHFIPLLLLYYAASPLLYRLARRFGYILLAIIACGQLILIAMIFPDTLGSLSLSWAELIPLPAFVFETTALWAIFFPLGLVYGVNSKSILPWLRRFKWVLVTVTVALFAIEILSAQKIMQFKGATYLYPLTFLFLVPMIKRNSIPHVRRLEEIGKRSYGLYLTHLVVMDIILLIIQILVPWLFKYHVALRLLVVFVLATGIPLLTMNAMSRSRARAAFRFVFG